MTQAKILPTVGRVVWFFDTQRHPGFHRSETPGEENGPYAAQIARVVSDDLVNLSVLDANGTPFGFMNVPLRQDGAVPGSGCWCEWMPYQKGQAAKTEAVERSLGNLSKHLGLVPLPVVDIAAMARKAPSVTPADLEAEIADTEIVKHVSKSGQVLRWAVLTTRNGFAVVGKPSCAVSSQNDNAQTGETVAIENSKHELWPLLGFRLRDRLHESAPKTGAQAGVCRTTFEELVRHGLAECLAEHRDDSIVNGMPWSFTYKGMPVSHENDDCYMVGGLRFERGQVLVTTPGEPPRILPAEAAG